MLENLAMKSTFRSCAMRLSATLAGLACVTLPTVARAHPGEHGSDWLDAVMHLLSEPDHLAAAILAVIVAIAGVRALVRRNRRDTSPLDR